MTNQDVLNTLEEILRNLLFKDTLELTESTKREDVPDWDSFAYVNFIVLVEMHFDIKFSVAEVESFVTVGDIAARIAELNSL